MYCKINSTLCQARKKLSHSAFIELIHKGVEFFTAHFSPKTWHGFRLLITDGSTIKVPRTEEVSDYFGALNPAKGECCPVARVSQLFDVLNHIIIDVLIAPKSHGDCDLVAQHFAHIGPQGLILLDRGYPALWLFHLILNKGAHLRRPVEESYKLFKSRIELENFICKSVEAVKQDFYARIFMLNLTSMLAFPVQDLFNTNHKDCKYSYQISWTQALAKMKNVEILLFIRETIAPIILNFRNCSSGLLSL